MSQSLIPLIAVLILRTHTKAWAAYFMGIKCPLPQPLRAPTRWPNSLGQIYRQSQKLTVFLWRDSDNVCTPRQRNQFWYKACKACLIPKFGNFNSILCTFSFVSDENMVSKYKSRPFNILGLEIDYHTQQAVSQESAKGPMFIKGFFHQAKLIKPLFRMTQVMYGIFYHLIMPEILRWWERYPRWRVLQEWPTLNIMTAQLLRKTDQHTSIALKLFLELSKS